MTGHAMSPPPAAQPPPAMQPPPPMMPMTPVPIATARPGGVTYACVLSIVLGAIGALAGLFIMAFAAAFSAVPIVGAIFGTFGLLLGVLSIAMGVLGIVAGAQGLGGASWSRWTMVVLFGLGALFSLSTIVVPALNITAIVMLCLQPATAFFEGTRTMTPS